MKQALIKLRKAGATIVSLVSPELKLTKFRKTEKIFFRKTDQTLEKSIQL